jgi:hypothetical protein
MQFSHHQFDIVLLVDGVYTLTNVVIIDPIRVDLVPQVVISYGVVMIVVAEVKDYLYHDQFSMDMFLL